MMQAFFAGQMDYIYFSYGLAFLFLSGMCFFLFYEHRSRKSLWLYLGLFAFIHGLFEWVDLFSFVFPHNVFLQTLRPPLLILSFLPLFEYARARLKGRWPLAFGRWIYLPFFFTIASVWLSQGAGAAAVLGRYFFGVLGGFGTASYIYQQSLDESIDKGFVFRKPFAILLFSYVVTQFFVSDSTTALLPWLTGQSFLDFIGIPVQAVRTLLIISATIVLSIYWDSIYQEKIPSNIYPNYQRLKKFFVVLLVFIVFIGLLFVNWRGMSVQKVQHENLINVAKLFSIGIHPQDLQKLSGTMSDLKSQEYAQLRGQLKNFMDALAHKNFRWAYLMIKKEDGIIFLVDSVPEGEFGHTDPGVLYSDAPSDLYHIFKTGQSAVVGPYSDQWGTFMSGFSPVLDPQSSNVVAVFGVDFNAEQFWGVIQVSRLWAILNTLAFVSFLVGFVVFYFRGRLAEERFKATEINWKALVREAPAIISLLDTSGKVQYINKTTSGIEPNRVIGKDARERLDAFEQKRFESVLKRVIERKESVTYENKIIRKDGTEVWYENHVGPVKSGSEVTHVIWFAFDVSERKIVEDKLRKLSRAVDQSPVAVLITDRTGKIEYVNPKFTESTGYTIQEILGKTPSMFKSGETSSETYRELWGTINSGRVWKGELHNKRKNQEPLWEDETISPIFDDDGQITHFIAVREDITERRKIERALRDSEQRLTDLINSIPSPLFVKNVRGQYIDCNQAFVDAVGRSREKIIGSTVFDVSSLELAAIYHKADLDLIMSKGKQTYPGKFKHADGTLRDVIFYKSCLFHTDGAVRGLVGVILDVTELKAVEQELRDNQTALIQALEDVKKFNEELEKAQEQLLQSEKLAAIGFLAAGVAHEINNPLGYIRGNMTALEEYINALMDVICRYQAFRSAFEAVDPGRIESSRLAVVEAEERYQIHYVLNDLKNLFRETQEGAERIKTIIQDLRRFSRTDTGERIPASINDVVDGIINIVWNELKYKVELVKEYGDNLPLVACNVQQVGQVFVNILVNASQAIDEKGVVKIRSYFNNDFVCVDITDTGKGIAPENITKVFDPFFTTKPPGQGTGLGLSISYDIIKKHAGSIHVSSVVGQGTTFTVSLPPAVKSPEDV